MHPQDGIKKAAYPKFARGERCGMEIPHID